MKMSKQLFALVLVALFFSSAQIQAGSGKDLRAAAKAGDLAAVKKLLAEGVDPNSQGGSGGTALHKAAKEGKLEVIQVLLNHGANPTLKNNKGKTALDVAESNGDRNAVDVMQAAIRPNDVVVRTGGVSEAEFRNAVTNVLLGRHWAIETSENGRITANYNRSGRNFKVEVALNGQVITIGFIKGYGATKNNYLNNLKVDLERGYFRPS